MTFLATIGAKIGQWLIEKLLVWAIKTFALYNKVRKKNTQIDNEVDAVKTIVAKMKKLRKEGKKPSPELKKELKDAMAHLNSGTYTK